jgi:uncharacterized protein
VLDFLDVAGNWDPSLLLVMGGAVAVTAIFFRPLIRKKGVTFIATSIDASLVIGAAVFGLGWGIGGYCPGPALTALSNLSAEAFVFVMAMIVGGILGKIPARLTGSLAQR